ncbi:hypothetical protein ACW2QC_14895 [Virgibacillus sp. FSP13]
MKHVRDKGRTESLPEVNPSPFFVYNGDRKAEATVQKRTHKQGEVGAWFLAIGVPLLMTVVANQQATGSGKAEIGCSSADD